MSLASKKESTRVSTHWNDLARERITAATDVELDERIASTARRHSARAQAKLDDEIDNAVNAVAMLRMARNSLSLISMLPTDVLPLIFYFCTRNNPAFPNWAAKSTGWLAVTWVCSVWRVVAIHAPILWADIPFNAGERVAEVFLERAKSVPLTIRIPVAKTLGPNPAFVKNVQLISSHIEHTEELSLSASMPLYTAILNNLLVPAPLLKDVDVKSLAHRNECLDLPPNAFICRAPMLRWLTLTNVMVPWTSISWANLQSLIVCHCNSPEQSTLRGHCFDLLKGLSSSTHLEELVLHRCLPASAQHHIPPTTIPLSHLKVVDISGFHDDCLWLYRLLAIPPSALVNLSLWFRGGREVDVQTLVSILQDRLTPTSDELSPIQTLALTSSSISSYLKLQAWRSLTSDLNDTTFEDNAHIHDPFSATMHMRANFGLELCDVHMERNREREILATLCRAVPLDDLRRLSLNSFQASLPWNKGVWLDLFGRAKHLRSVKLYREASHSFTAALVTVPDDAIVSRSQARGAAGRKFKNAPRRDLFLPDLRSLYLEDVALDGDFSGQPFHKKLAGYLRIRSKRAPLESLYLTDCTLYEDMLDELMGIQGLNLVWDGTRGEYEEDEEDYVESDDYLSDFF